MRIEQFIASRSFIRRLADIEKKRLKLEKEFRETNTKMRCRAHSRILASDQQGRIF